MSHDELLRYLKAHGATFEEKTRHTMVRVGGRTTILPRHGRKEVPTGTLHAILRDLGLPHPKRS